MGAGTTHEGRTPLSQPMRYMLATAYTTAFDMGAIGMTLSLLDSLVGSPTNAPRALPVEA
jgi:hypothetical protein